MKTKYVCRGLISLYVNFYNNRTMWSTNLHEKICRWWGGGGGGGKGAIIFLLKLTISDSAKHYSGTAKY